MAALFIWLVVGLSISLTLFMEELALRSVYPYMRKRFRKRVKPQNKYFVG